jgi:hypothetical protein
MDEKTKIARINQVVTDYFKSNPSVNKIPAMDLMPEFVKAGIFNKDYEREGLPIRNLLRKLDRNNELNKIPTLLPERKSINTYWYFQRPKS